MSIDTTRKKTSKPKKEKKEGNKGEKKAGRPSKISSFIQAAEELLAEFPYAGLMTDKDLWLLVNCRLEENGVETVSYDRYKRWVSESRLPKDDQLCHQFRHLIKRSRALQQLHSIQYLMSEKNNNWQAKITLMQRKFPEWMTPKDKFFQQQMEAGTDKTTVNVNIS